MNESIDKMNENIVVVGEVRETVKENTRGVERSTAEIRNLQKVNTENQKVILNAMHEASSSNVHKLAGLALLLLLFLPCVILGVSYFNLPRKK
jgi:methyl-accepting chemotaxis protein